VDQYLDQNHLLLHQLLLHHPAPITPTASEVSHKRQQQAMDGYDARKTKAKGRSATILTGPKGVEEETLTLGKRSLLGQ
jgi:hypothetical protein